MVETPEKGGDRRHMKKIDKTKEPSPCLRIKPSVLGIVGVSIIVLAGICLIMAQRFSEAKIIAINYVAEKYDFDTECLGGNYAWHDSRYNFIFQSKTKDGKPLTFAVSVEHDLTIRAEHISGEKRYVADGYLYARFEHQVEEYIEEVLNGEQNLDKVIVLFENSAIYGYALPIRIDEESSLEDALQGFDIEAIALYYNGLDESLGQEKLENAVKTLETKGVSARRITAYDINGPQKMAEIERE